MSRSARCDPLLLALICIDVTRRTVAAAALAATSRMGAKGNRWIGMPGAQTRGGLLRAPQFAADDPCARDERAQLAVGDIARQILHAAIRGHDDVLRRRVH